MRVLRTPLSDYDRYACDWGYAYNVPTGEDTRVLDLAERSLSAAVVDHDFWLVDHDYRTLDQPANHRRLNL